MSTANSPHHTGTPTESGTLLGWVTQLVHCHRKRLLRAVQREGLRTEDALDCVQDAFHSFLVLPQARLLVDSPEDSAKLLTVLAKNLARNRRRRHDRARPHLGDDEVLAALPTDTATADQLVAQSEAYALMVGCVATLSQLQRTVVSLRLVDEVPGEDAARLLGISPGHLAILLHRAKKQLRSCLPTGED
jgi:RNA polymerase sigma-70 factor, ECF subfamily